MIKLVSDPNTKRKDAPLDSLHFLHEKKRHVRNKQHEKK
jgi:hypothetical protein